MAQVSIEHVLHYDIMYKNEVLAVWKKSKPQETQTGILETLSSACCHMLLVIASKACMHQPATASALLSSAERLRTPKASVPPQTPMG